MCVWNSTANKLRNKNANTVPGAQEVLRREHGALQEEEWKPEPPRAADALGCCCETGCTPLLTSQLWGGWGAASFSSNDWILVFLHEFPLTLQSPLQKEHSHNLLLLRITWIILCWKCGSGLQKKCTESKGESHIPGGRGHIGVSLHKSQTGYPL